MYKEFQPSAGLQEIVECFWTVKGPAANSHRPVFPDGGMDIIFNFGHPIEVISGGERLINRTSAFVVGNMTRPIFSRTMGTTDLLGIRFRPGGLSSILPVPLWRLTDLSVSLDDVCGSLISRDELTELSDTERLNRIANRIRAKANRFQQKESWRQALREVVTAVDDARVYRLAKTMGISQKHLERKFSEEVGLTPKQLMQVLRFRKLLNSLRQRPAESLLSLAVDHGFTDHAHLTRFFKSFAEITPSEFRQQVR